MTSVSWTAVWETGDWFKMLMSYISCSKETKTLLWKGDSKTLVTVGARHPPIRMDNSLLVCSFISTHCLSLLSSGKRAQAWGLLIFYFKNKSKPKQTKKKKHKRKNFQTMEINSYSDWPVLKSMPWGAHCNGNTHKCT